MVYERIASYLAKNGIKHSIVATKSGMTKQAFSSAMRGERKISVEEYVAICRAIGVSTDAFSGEKITRKAS